jgi:DNA-binding transcriptional LysR family regulator
MNTELRKAVIPAHRRAMHVNVRHLEVFWAVMRSGNQHEAARILNLSQPAISKIIRYTEDRMGVLLFRRIKGRLHPTPEGQVFFRSVDEIFSRLDATERLARDLQRRLTGQVTLTTSAAFATALVPHALGAFMRSHPMVRAGVKVLTPAAVVERVANVPTGHDLASRPYLTAADLDGERLITATERPIWGKLIEDEFASAGVQPNIAVECTQPDLAFAMAEAGAGIAVVPPAPIRPETAMALTVCQFQPAIPIPVMVLTHAVRPLPLSVEALIEQLRKSASLCRWPGLQGQL